MGKFFASNLTVLSKSLEKSTVELIVEDDMKREREVLHPFSFFVDSPNELSNRLIEFFRRIYSLKGMLNAVC